MLCISSKYMHITSTHTSKQARWEQDGFEAPDCQVLVPTLSADLPGQAGIVKHPPTLACKRHLHPPRRLLLQHGPVPRESRRGRGPRAVRFPQEGDQLKQGPKPYSNLSRTQNTPLPFRRLHFLVYKLSVVPLSLRSRVYQFDAYIQSHTHPVKSFIA